MSSRILVVDDEPDFVELISFHLRANGLDVISASNGLDAVFKARRFRPDLVVLDLMMEGIDGYSVCEILRRQEATRHLPIIMVTAASGQLARMNGLAIGANAFLHKPIAPREVIRCIQNLLAGCAPSGAADSPQA